MSNPLQYREGGRGTGKTTRLIKATPKGGIYVVTCGAMAGIVKRYLEEIDRPNELEVIGVDDLVKRLRGTRGLAVAIDHTVRLTAEENTLLAYAAALILETDYEGDVTTTYIRSK